MGEIIAQWISVGDQMYQRSELYGPNWTSEINGPGGKSPERILPASFGGPVLSTHGNVVLIHKSSGPEISKFPWRGAKIVNCGWSHKEEAVFVQEDGGVVIYGLFGELISSTTMGQEAKDVGVKEARIFISRGMATTGVAILTTTKRFFIVYNIHEPKVRRMHDIQMDSKLGDSFPWEVLPYSSRQARIAIGGNFVNPGTASISCISVLSQTDSSIPIIDTMPHEKTELVSIAVATDGIHVGLYYSSGVLWMGEINELAGPDGITKTNKLCHVDFKAIEENYVPESFTWCGLDSLICISNKSARLAIVSKSGECELIFMFGFMCASQEIDGCRLFSRDCQEMIQAVSPSLHQVFAVASTSPGALLRLASEDFDNGSHRANERIRQVGESLDEAVRQCIEAAGLVSDPVHQKELLRAAQFGKSFTTATNRHITAKNADAFSNACKTLRVMNALRHYRVGIPITMSQYKHLTPTVVVDRLLARRLYPLAASIADWLGLPQKFGRSRVLAHWACYKVTARHSDEDDKTVANAIRQKLGNHPQISYCDIAAKAADGGKKDLAIRLLENETSVSKQVPLLITLGQESQALTRALGSGNRDLAYSVILHLRKNLPSTDFHMLIRKYPLGKTLYEGYCQSHGDLEALQDWYVQEDDFSSQATTSFEKAMAASRPETRMAQLVNVQELFMKSVSPAGVTNSTKGETYAAFAEEQHRLLKCQTMLEEKLPGKSFIGLSLHSTLADLVRDDEMRLADKVLLDCNFCIRLQ